MSTKEPIYDESFEKANRLNKRLATINDYYLIIVTTRPFTEYLGDTRYGSLTEFVAADEKNDLMAFIDSYDGSEKKKIFHFKNALGEMRLNMLNLHANKQHIKTKEINIEMLDIESLYDTNQMLFDDIKRDQALFGLTKEYTFTYNVISDTFIIYRYDMYSKDTIYKMSLNQWKDFMIDEGFIADSDIDLFKNLVSQIMAYDQSFSAKITSSMRTHKQVMEKLVFTGMVHNKYNGERIVIGRILSEENAHGNNSIVEMLSDLSYDSLTNVYNKKTITEYAQNLISSNTNKIKEKATDGLMSNIAVLILDLDNFKKVNDQYGHMYGDKVLARTGRKLKDVIGEGGIIGRIGGDEFLIIIFDVIDENILRSYLRALRTQIKWEFINDFADFNITCSIGASQYPKDSLNYDDIFKKADYCLYISKEKGRDRYVFFREELHGDGYRESINSTDKKPIHDRETHELSFVNHILEEYAINRRAALKELLEHFIDCYGADSINIYNLETKKREFTLGRILDNSEVINYVDSEGFKTLLNGKKYASVSFVGRIMDMAPEFSNAMKARDVISTIQVLIGDKDNYIGLLTVDKAGDEPSKWATYERECALIASSLINNLIKDEAKPVIKD